MFGSKLSKKDRAIRTVLAFALLAATVLMVAWAVIYVTQQKTSEPSESAKAIAKEVAVVEITAGGLMPASISVVAGQQVKFINKDSNPHRLMADPEILQDFDSMNQLAMGDSYTYVFDTPGTYYYYDSVNSQAYTGSVNVKQQ